MSAIFQNSNAFVFQDEWKSWKCNSEDSEADIPNKG